VTYPDINNLLLRNYTQTIASAYHIPVGNTGYIPPQLPILNDNRYVVYYPQQQQQLQLQQQQQQNHANTHRKAEILNELNGLFCYTCWLWFCFVVSIINLVSGSLASFEPESKGEDIRIIGFVLNVCQIMMYYLGISAVQNRSFKRNEIFKWFLICGFAVILIGLAVVLVFNPQSPEGEALRLIMILYLILSTIINTALFVTAHKIGKLLKELEDLNRQSN